MDNEISLLHLSDAHIGHPDYSYDEPTVFDPLFTDIEKEDKVPDLIIFSGDLVYGEVPSSSIVDQYAKANEFLKKLHNCFKKRTGEIPLLIVPGNHDINRNQIDDGQKKARLSYTENDIIKWMKNDQDITWSRILERQTDWNQFVNSIPNLSWDFDSKRNTQTGIVDIKGIKIGVAGFNSSWSAQDDDDKGKLWIGRRAYTDAWNKIKDAEYKIAVSHHPCECLHEGEKKFITERIETNFDLHLYGHEHAAWFIHAKEHLKVAAGACFCGSNQKGHNYTWITINKKEQFYLLKLRTYTEDGKGAWIKHIIPGKTDDNGEVKLEIYSEPEKKAAKKTTEVKTTTTLLSIKNLPDFCSQIENHFHIRKECSHNCQFLAVNQLVYWPVRLRQPTPIHAAQSFLAGGLQKMGCKISLWIDDLGHTEYSTTRFISKLKQWYSVVGGDEKALSTNKFSDILNGGDKHIKPAWSMLQKWLGNMAYYTDNVLKISKIWPAISDANKESPETIISDIKKRRACRLMTPSMVWTCLSVLSQDNEEIPIVTLGGYDERGLWEAWRACTESTLRVCHLYVSQLTHKTTEGEQAIHMTDNPLAWESKDDIKNEFDKIIRESNTGEIWKHKGNMIPWIINNCVLLPSYIKNEKVSISDLNITNIEDL